jgi:hypothetical protein
MQERSETGRPEERKDSLFLIEEERRERVGLWAIGCSEITDFSRRSGPKPDYG